jgi:hypothetical protein
MGVTKIYTDSFILYEGKMMIGIGHIEWTNRRFFTLISYKSYFHVSLTLEALCWRCLIRDWLQCKVK